MNELSKIWANARYEMITLLRSWFFRIFAGSALGIFIFINIIFFSGVAPVPRIFHGLPSGIPYANMIMLNVAQIAIIIFMASDFFKRDRKFNTSEVFYIRSMSNASYLTGKALGVFILFAALNLLILMIAATIHLLFSELHFNWEPYLFYPLLIVFPAFIFMIGFSFLLMQLIKNQAVVVLLLLGYYAVVVFYLFDKWYAVFDLAAIKLPLNYSDFVGFADLHLILAQRGLYMVLGVLFLMVSILLFKRLHQSVLLRRLLVFMSFVFVVTGFLLGYYYLQWFSNIDGLRARMIENNQHYLNHPAITPLVCRIDVKHRGSSLDGETFYRFTNQTAVDLDTLIFSINPGMRVNSIYHGNTTVPFEQIDHLIKIGLKTRLFSGQTDSLLIQYTGGIKDFICYLDIEDYTQNNSFSIWLYKIRKKHAFLTGSYVLLPPGCLWYPRPGLPPGTGFPNQKSDYFIDFELDLQTDPNLVALSQGNSEQIEPGHYRFLTDHPVPDISLVIGKYEMEALQVDSVVYRLYRLADHDFYKTYFTEVSDTLESIIREGMLGYEVKLGLPYPYNRLSLIEVPVQYYVYPRIWTVSQEVVLPEQVWFQENAASIAGADFRRLKESIGRRLDRSNQTLTEAESQISVLQSFFNTTFLGEDLRGLRFGGPTVDYQPDYNLFANFYTYIVSLQSAKWPILNAALEAFLFDRVHSQTENRPVWFVEGLTSAEQVSQVLTKKSLSEYLTAGENKLLRPEMIKQKGAFLIKLLQNELGRDTFNRHLTRLINSSRFNTIGFDTFIDQIEIPPDFDIEQYLQTWYEGSALPTYLINDIRVFKVYDNDRIRTQLVLNISNTSTTTGLFEVSFDYNRRGMGFNMETSGEDDPPNILRLGAGETKQIGILLDEEPRAVNINFLIAGNLPLVFTRRFEKVELDERKLPFKGEMTITESGLSVQPNEWIVDNEGKGFEVFNPPFNSILKRLIHGTVDEQLISYDRFQWWDPPHQWRLIKNAAFFGTYIHSAYYIRPGDGQKYVSWSADIPAEGIYDIYIYMFDQENFTRGRRERRTKMFQDFNFSVHHTGGIEEVRFTAESAPEGWNFLGSWYLSFGLAKITLSDETDGRVVIADAIKWVKN